MDSEQGSVAVGIDLGGTKALVAWVDAAGRILGSVRRPTGAGRDPEAILDDLARTLRDERPPAVGERPVVGIGVGVAGQVEPGSGFLHFAPNLEWRDVPLRERLERAADLPVCVLNDVQAITYGEWQHGAGRGVDDVVGLFVGTGVGGGIIAAGRLLQGSGGSAGELGHLTIERDGPSCTCGNHGCLEAFCGGWAIARNARERVVGDRAAGAALLRHAGGETEAITAATVAAAAAEGDSLARRIVADAGAALGVGLACIANALNPAVIVLGGGVIDGLPELISAASAEARKRSLDAPFRNLRVVRSQLGAQAGAIGTAARARDAIATSGATSGAPAGNG